jgi:hypothetical protein
LTSRKALRRALACAAAGAAALALVVPAADAGEHVQLSLPADQFFSADFANPCNGETLVNVTGTVHFVGHVQGDPTTADSRQGIHFNTQGVSAIGAITGDRYTITDSSNTIENVKPEAARAFTGEVTLQAVSRSSTENFQIHDIVHFTTNANGDTTAVVIGGHADCRG